MKQNAEDTGEFLVVVVVATEVFQGFPTSLEAEY